MPDPCRDHAAPAHIQQGVLPIAARLSHAVPAFALLDFFRSSVLQYLPGRGPYPIFSAAA